MSADVDKALGYLLAVRATLVAVLGNVDAALQALADEGGQGGAEPPCAHDPEHDELVSTMKEKPRRRCKACGSEYETEATW